MSLQSKDRALPKTSGAKRTLLFVACAAYFCALAWNRNINWDEFYFLSHVFAYADARLDQPFQTSFVHLFGWLVHVPGQEMNQIFIARLIVTLLFVSTLWSLHRIALELSDRFSADIAVVAFVTSGFVLAHGTSFRADPIATACLMGAVAIIVTGRMSVPQVGLVAVLSAAAVLVTAKSVLYLPVFLGALVWRWGDRKVVTRIFIAGVLGVAIAAFLYLSHASGIESPPQTDSSASPKNAVVTTLLEAGFAPRFREWVLWALLSLGALVLISFGLLAPMTGKQRAMMIGFIAPVVFCALFYRNAYPYFFAFITPPMMVLAAIGASRVGRGAFLGTIATLMVGTGIAQAIKALSESATLQRATIAEVHRLFPEPVPYIDQNGMIASFPRDVFFMSTWGITRYRAGGEPVIAELVENTAPPLLLANRWALKQAINDQSVFDHPLLLLPEDQEALRNTYVHYSGAIWLAGREVKLDVPRTEIELPIAGRYLLESETDIRINNELMFPGMSFDIGGSVIVEGAVGQSFRLIWDAPGSLIDLDLPEEDLYADFWRL